MTSVDATLAVDVAAGNITVVSFADRVLDRLSTSPAVRAARVVADVRLCRDPDPAAVAEVADLLRAIVADHADAPWALRLLAALGAAA